MPDSTTTATDEPSSSSGTTALEGFIYQKDVSVWVSLDLLLVRKVAKRVVLEPVTEEDLETDIEDEPGAMAQATALDTYRLIVQCKVKSTGPWTHQEIGRLLTHGTRRKSAAERLKDPSARYLLITTADLQGVARHLRVDEVGAWPRASDLPPEIGAKLPSLAGGRIGILGPMDQERVRRRIDVILTERFRVPVTKLAECRERLRACAFERMLGGSGGVWTREEIEQEIRRYGGYVGESADLEGFVPPTNWAELEEALDKRHAVLITGASGTGKTKAAKALIARLRDRVPGIRHEVIRGGPEKIYEDHLGGPVVYEIEDPWGKFRLDETSVPWNDAIDDLLQSANSDRKFVVTSRSDVLRESAPKTLRPKWIVHLEEENYGLTERRRLFDNRLPGLPFDLQTIVVRYAKEAVEGLTTPLEMHRYFNILSDGLRPKEHERDYIKRCLQDAHQNSIETSIVANVEKRRDWQWAAIIWGLFKARDRQSFHMLPRIQAALSAHDQSLEDGLIRYISFLVAGRNIRQSDEVLAYQHPRVELGLEQAMLSHANLSSRVLRYLLETFISFDRESGGDWGTESAAYLMAAIARHHDLQPDIPRDIASTVDEWLEKRVAAAGPEFEDDLKLAAAVGSPLSVVAELARWLTYRDPNRAWHAFDHWQPPERPPEWYDWVSRHEHTKAICEAFIIRSLPRVHGRFGSDFADQIARLSPDLTPAFAHAAGLIIEGGYHPNDNAIVAGALKDINGFEPVVRQAVEYLAHLASDQDREFWLALKNGEYDEGAAEHYYEDAGEEGYTARELLAEYVRLRRRTEGWTAVARHPLVAGLVEAWLKVLQDQSDATDDEWQAIAAVAEGWEESRLWELLRGRLPASLHPRLERALCDGNGRNAIRIEAVRTAIADAPEVLSRVVEALQAGGQHARLLELAMDIAASPDREFSADVASLGAAIVSRLPAPLDQALAPFLGQEGARLSPEAVALLQSVDDSGRLRVQLHRARVLNASGLDVSALIDGMLRMQGDNSDGTISDVADAIDLAEAAGYTHLVFLGLGHRFADVRERALSAFAARSASPLNTELLGFAGDKGNRVRRRVVDILDQKRHPDHLETLVRLSGDDWSNHAYHYEEPANYPIAIRASEILLTTTIGDEHVDALATVIKASKDSEVQLNLLRALVRNGSDAARNRVLRLALKTGSPPLHRYAALALIAEADKVQPDEAAGIGDNQLQSRIADVAVSLAYLLALRAPEARVIAAAQALSPGRLVLLVPLLLGAYGQSEDLGRDVQNLLPLKLKEIFASLPASLPEVTAHDLSEFGEVRIVEAVAAWLKASRANA
ncbi:hypothetical protein NKH54_08575 [Mesorhizobium sp. M1004]|uniref:nSTAND3 domain-containing NTPase n=1 Tax=Mesorhizobium sp. M1004 TaxID=2957046 RepID=UPI00333AC5DC